MPLLPNERGGNTDIYQLSVVGGQLAVSDGMIIRAVAFYLLICFGRLKIFTKSVYMTFLVPKFCVKTDYYYI